MKKTVSDGWHTVYGYDVYVEDGKVIRGLKQDYNGYDVAAWPYRKTSYGWTQEKMTLDAFRAGVNRETVALF